jgi:hypothetical protein
LDAEQGHYWPVDRSDGRPAMGLLATQRRHVMRAGRLLGLGGDAAPAERVGMFLDLDGMVLEQARAEYAEGTLRHRGRGVLRVLCALSSHRDDRLLAAGHAAGLWGRVWRVDPATGRRRSLPWRDPPTSFVLPPDRWAR